MHCLHHSSPRTQKKWQKLLLPTNKKDREFDMSTIFDCVASLEGMRDKLHKIFPKFITHIRFPKFKNLTPDTRIDFSFPVTALVGANGSGKTSVLHALYGAPYRNSTGDFWFSTEVDPIVEGDGSPNRFIYGHYHSQAKTTVETRKARVRKVINGIENPNYWEPTKLAPGDGMAALPVLKNGQKWTGLSSDRWTPISRKVIYINFRKELSAFDKYFYFGHDPHLTRLKKKQDLIRRDAKTLQQVIDAGNLSILVRNKQIALENRNLSEDELTWIGFILGRNYTSARYIRHALFKGKDGISVQFTTAHGKYSEAFAGSGEVAVTSVVVQVLKALPGTLVLLDEPEVSLHPGAQERLLEFLLEMSKQRKAQVVFSTHAPNMLAGLPNDAIKVFIHDKTGTFSVIPESHPYAAFRRLGVKHGGEVRVVVEDRLAKAIVTLALRSLDDADSSRFVVDFHSGGSSAILTYRIPIEMSDGTEVFFLLDGDKKMVDAFVDPNNLPVAADATLSELIKQQVEVTPMFTPDGNGQGNAGQKIQLQRQYLAYIRSHLQYLPLRCPEEIVVNMYPEWISKKGITDSLHAKQILKDEAEKILGQNVSSEKIDNFAEVKLAERRETCAELTAIAEMLKIFAGQVNPK
jgi:predicted ATPase